jgi:type IV secretory pathway VirD2 relaxase
LERKTLDLSAKFGDFAIKRQATWRMSAKVLRKLAAQSRKSGVRSGFKGRHIGRGRGALPLASRRPGGLSARHMRRVTVKVHIARTGSAGGFRAFGAHIHYLQRDGVDRDGQGGELYERDGAPADGKAFLARSEDDRHQFRFIVSPEDDTEVTDMQTLTRQLMARMERDTRTRLDWVAADHHNTGYPHTHIVVRGRDDQGRDLVIAPDYLTKGLRGRASQIVTETLGPRRDIDIARAAGRDVSADRFTGLDREIAGRAMDGRVRIIQGDGPGGRFREALVARRMKHLESLYLATKSGARDWALKPGWEAALQAMGRRGDIVRSLAKGLPAEIAASGVRFPDERLADAGPLEGIVLAQGPGDELRDTRFLVVEDMRGAQWYVPADGLLPGDLPPVGGVVEMGRGKAAPRAADLVIADIAERSGGAWSEALHQASDPASSAAFRLAHKRRLEALRRAGIVTREADGGWEIPPDYLRKAAAHEAGKGARVVVRSWMALEAQANARALTWLDEAELESSGQVSARLATARQARLTFLRSEGLLGEGEVSLSAATRLALRHEEFERVIASEAARSGRSVVTLDAGQSLEGKFERAIGLAQGRMALVGNEKAFALVPWRSGLDHRRGQSLVIEQKSGGISWTLPGGRPRGLSR